MAPDATQAIPITGERIIRNAEDKKKQHQLMLAALRKISIKNNIWPAAEWAGRPQRIWRFHAVRTYQWGAA
ncbi:MAG: hypothetical protein EOQ92_27765 [Mesorhizobium sp.]|uniref:hypothetical protein n=1 Tax=Mesorhizobium sp. TaxID=1871066 RepID=UPI000FE93362|nr:hypothetical protein [Mesorhizobium sp.]RWI14908.1 MAG: hypothetical protein EOQ92_27765 [Mesorhizobium sp.]RWI54789.1 MAG: hypothetical protein EOR16_23770 [Mesorhizobium sp.]RWK93344.1 MAG: hypothetical protein EOR53_23315 [Mesorhizobium sp.]TIP28198.1 MAG: hypothetical protein E5X67_12595 [Mesorhizobium sp.]TJW52371.1 MAG: hypothetical protein E5X59_08250 [Mesorhizobium sp.]